MLTLAIECATKTVGLALLHDDDVHAEMYLRLGRHHAEVLLPALEQLFLLTGFTPASVDLFVCTLGPGSFTGLRIGVSTVKGLALATGKPIGGVSTLEALAMNAFPSPNLICPMLDARKNQVYAGLYRMGSDALPKAVNPEKLTDITAFLKEIDREEVVFVGDGAIRYENLIRDTMKGRAIVCGSGQHNLMASAVGLIGLHRYRTGNILETLTFTPRYLRVS
ncbi:MAG: tRNA (adenosine(37)-N6)-threonylcarbamoyltransferase complex dimerization subunit type 1 TsaB, partial [Syntrophales bacterium LBB04]|nr:tRNA (adenosine(37)-N6)-threonylcarbamoyltransferase complex dimerization subunit type 1 TsaB [Syntrophales bacterium LBB04]